MNEREIQSFFHDYGYYPSREDLGEYSQEYRVKEYVSCNGCTPSQQYSAENIPSFLSDSPEG